MFRLTKITVVPGTALLADTAQVALAQTIGATTTKGLNPAATSVSGNFQENPDSPGLRNASGRLKRNAERRETQEMEQDDTDGHGVSRRNSASTRLMCDTALCTLRMGGIISIDAEPQR